MSPDILKQKIKYHYKKYCAIGFAVLGTSLLAGNDAYIVIYDLVKHISPEPLDLFGVLFAVLILAAYLMILIGNVEGNHLAFTGMLMFIFYIAWDFGENFLLYGLINLEAIFSGDFLSVLLMSFISAFMAFALVSGIMTYIRTRQYLTHRYYKYNVVRNWCLVFMICTCVGVGLLPIYDIISSPSINIVLIFLESLSEVAMAIACFFTILRLNSEY
jgi:hypothetical protein